MVAWWIVHEIPSQLGFGSSEPINYCVRNDSKLPGLRAYTKMRLLSLSVSLSLDLSLSVSVSRFLSVKSCTDLSPLHLCTLASVVLRLVVRN